MENMGMKKSELRKIIKEEIISELFGLGKKNVKPFFDEDWNEDKIKGKKLNKEQQLVKNSILEAFNKINEKANQKWGVDAKIEIKVEKLIDNGLVINYKISSSPMAGSDNIGQQKTINIKAGYVSEFIKELEGISEIGIKTNSSKKSTGTYTDLIFNSTITSK